ncbi:transcription factor bHLH143-like [Apium graveolens]
MVCQAASQTKFRALKHENGISGRVIVRVIACFQHLEDCQAEYFRLLLKPVTYKTTVHSWYLFWLMVKANDPWLGKEPYHCDAANVDHMGSILPSTKQSFAASNFNPFAFSANAPFPEFSHPALRERYGLSGDLPSHMESSLFPLDPFIKDSQSASVPKFGVKTMANNVTSSNRRSYVIFDQSDDLVSFFLGSFGPSSGKFVDIPMRPVHVGCTHDVQQIPINEQTNSTNLKIQRPPDDDDQVAVEESEFHEDSEEINALLYSDDEYDNNYGEEDCDGEVTSTDRSPSKVEEILSNDEQVGAMIEEVATSDGSTKRQRLLNGDYQKSLVVEHANLGGNDRYCKCNHDMESSSACSSAIGNVISSNLGVKQSRKDKIHETLTIIENIIPGLKSKEPTLIIDEAISYLKSLKLKAKALGLAYP